MKGIHKFQVSTTLHKEEVTGWMLVGASVETKKRFIG